MTAVGWCSEGVAGVKAFVITINQFCEINGAFLRQEQLNQYNI